MAETTSPAVAQRSVDRRARDNAYGDGVNRAAVERATPNTNTPVHAKGAAGGGGRPTASGPPPPGSLASLTGPSQRPGEPLTAGLPMGEGPGPTEMPAPVDDALWELRALAQRYPSRDLLRLIALAESRL